MVMVFHLPASQSDRTFATAGIHFPAGEGWRAPLARASPQLPTRSGTTSMTSNPLTNEPINQRTHEPVKPRTHEPCGIQIMTNFAKASRARRNRLQTRDLRDAAPWRAAGQSHKKICLQSHSLLAEAGFLTFGHRLLHTFLPNLHFSSIICAISADNSDCAAARRLRSRCLAKGVAVCGGVGLCAWS